MPFHRFEDIASKSVTPHLSSGTAPIIEGRYLYFCMLSKKAGTGSELHYHPNELLIFPVRGKINAIVGKDRRIVGPGMFVHAPAYARHSMRATEDGDLDYLYIKDKTWTVVGLAENEAVPDKAMTVDEVNRKHDAGELARRQTGAGKSQAIVEGLHTCFYPLIESLDAPRASARRESWIEGERLAFGFCELPRGQEIAGAGEHETFAYVLSGTVMGTVSGAATELTAGGILQAPRGERFSLRATSDAARVAIVRSTGFLEQKIDRMTPEEQEQARINLKAN
jgi:quercetin dioxygenase-like cupin family protein